jgi:hypothetical protein
MGWRMPTVNRVEEYPSFICGISGVVRLNDEFLALMLDLELSFCSVMQQSE